MAHEFNPYCWLATHGKWENRGSPMPACDGQLCRCHLIDKQVLIKEIGLDVVWDDAVWVWGCGGPMGNAGHHGHLDYSKRLRIPFTEIPRATMEFAKEHDLVWWLERTYKRRTTFHGGGRSHGAE